MHRLEVSQKTYKLMVLGKRVSMMTAEWQIGFIPVNGQCYWTAPQKWSNYDTVSVHYSRSLK